MSDRHLTKCELEVMDVVWKLGRATVRDVCAALERPLAYTTVMTTLHILDEKRGVVRRSKEGRAHVYEPVVTRAEVCRAVAGELRRHLFTGGIHSLVLSLIDADSLSRHDIDELKATIASLEARE